MKNSRVDARGGSIRKQVCIGLCLGIFIAVFMLGLGNTTYLIGIYCKPPQVSNDAPARDDGDGVSPVSERRVDGIPKIIHTIWLSARPDADSTNSSAIGDNSIPPDGPIPNYLSRNLARYEEQHPGYKVLVWTNKDIIQTFPELSEIMKVLTAHKRYLSWLSDVLRFAVLLKMGGIYLDTDFEAIKSMEPLREAFPDGFTTCVLPTAKDKLVHPDDIESVQDFVLPPGECTNVNCGQIGAPPGHPAILKSYATAIHNSFRHFKVVEKGDYAGSAFFSGPRVWTDAVGLYNFTVLMGELFYPCPVKRRRHCKASDYEDDAYAFAMHKWTGSWKKDALTEEE